MKNKDFTEFTEEELIDEAKKMKSFSITNALFIGFLVGIILYSIVKNSWGMLTLIPLYFIYRMVNDPKNKRSKDLDKLLIERNLKNNT
ncbi:MAG: FUSC family protein [Saprospiraceae bacterium]|nr:FUSC family protein [Candidatus Defluviibacterium haderslevense]